jgi:hypothetical protein
LSESLQSGEYVDAVNNLWLYNTPDFDNFGETLKINGKEGRYI